MFLVDDEAFCNDFCISVIASIYAIDWSRVKEGKKFFNYQAKVVY